MSASDDYSHFYILIKITSSVHGFVLSREGQDLQISFLANFGNESNNQICL